MGHASETNGRGQELADWERGHYNALLQQQEQLKEEYWSTGGFSRW